MIPRPRELAGTAAIAVVIACAVLLAFVGLAHLSLGTGRDVIAVPVNAAFKGGVLDRDAAWLHGDTAIGAHQYNDCLILFQALDDRAPAARRAVSPLSVPVDTDSSCAVLADFAAGVSDPPVRHYHQYLHAHTTLARLLLPSLDVSGLRGLYKLLIVVTLLAGIGYALIGMVRGRRMVEHLAWLAVFLAFARWFGLESFGQSLGHGPADLVILVFLLFLLRGSTNAPLGPRAAILAAAAFGALTVQFEFLTGGLPLGLAIMVGAVPIALAERDDLAAVHLRAILAYLVAAVTTMAAKLVLVTLTFGGDAVVDLARQFLFRTGVSHISARDTPVGLAEFVDHGWAGLEALAPGMHGLTAGMLVLATVAGIWGYRQLRDVPDTARRYRAAALLGSMLVPPLWMVVFWQHTAQHAWFMDRILVWNIAAGALLFILAMGWRTRAGEGATSA